MGKNSWGKEKKNTGGDKKFLFGEMGRHQGGVNGMVSKTQVQNLRGKDPAHQEAKGGGGGD